MPDFLQGTDLKVHKAVIESETLSQVGALLALASTICYFAVSTQFAWGIALGLTTLAAGKFFSAETAAPPEIEHESERSYSGGGGGSRLAPFVDGQPIGMRNASMNCWANAMFQFILHGHDLRQVLQDGGPEIFRTAITNYELQQADKTRVSKINSQGMREWFSGWIRGFSSNRAVQQDAHEPLAYLMQRFMPLINIFYQRPENPSANGIIASSNIHTISLEGSRQDSFERLVAHNYIQGQDDVGYFVRFFEDLPHYLVFHLDRFGGNWQRGQKINDRIQMSTTFNFPGAWVQTGEDGTYTCTAFIEHTGRSIQGGHYIAYVLVDGQWWLCDDTSVTKVSAREAERRLGYCYIAYYQKTEE
jgi:hypothetical protein